MPKPKRIYQIAKEIDVLHQDIVKFLKSEGYDVTNHMSPVNDDIHILILKQFTPNLVDQEIERIRQGDRTERTVSSVRSNSSKPQKNSDEHEHEQVGEYFGRIKFYDYRKNNFGFIGDVCNKDGSLSKDVYISEDSLIHSPRDYYDGRYVHFDITVNTGRPRGEKVGFLETGTPEFLESIFAFPNSMQLSMIEMLVHSSEGIQEVWKPRLVELLESINDEEARKFLAKFDDEYLEKNFDDRHTEYSDSELLHIIKTSQNNKMVINAINEWSFDSTSSASNSPAPYIVEKTIELASIEPFLDEVTSDYKRLEGFIAGMEISKASEEAVASYQGSIFEMLLSKKEGLEPVVLMLVLNKANSPDIKNKTVQRWDFNSGQQSQGPYSDFNSLFLEWLENESLEVLDLGEFREQLPARIAEANPARLIEWFKLFPSDELAKLLIEKIGFDEPEWFASKIQKLENLFQVNRELFLRVLSGLDIPGKEIIELFMGLNLDVDPTTISKFFENRPQSIQFYLMRYLVSLYSQGELSESTLTTMLNTIEWTSISAVIALIFIRERQITMPTLRAELNDKYKRALLNRPATDLKISELINTCNGRAKFRGNIRFDWGKKTYSFDGSFGIEKDFGEDMFCEGRFWKAEPFFNENTGRMTQKHYPMYWCRGETCAQPNLEADVNGQHFGSWSLLEIAEVLGFQIDQKFLSLFAGWANRMNEIMERLTCRSCSDNLVPEPFDPVRLGFYAVPIFKCINEECSECGKQVRLTHCLNGNCSGENNRIIDSRDCPQCSNGWLVCQDCNACCPDHHDQKTVSCKSCGTGMQRGEEYFSCPQCREHTYHDDLKSLVGFWGRATSYDPKLVQRR